MNDFWREFPVILSKRRENPGEDVFVLPRDQHGPCLARHGFHKVPFVQLLTWVAARGELFCNDWPIGQRGIRQEVLITYESTA